MNIEYILNIHIFTGKIKNPESSISTIYAWNYFLSLDNQASDGSDLVAGSIDECGLVNCKNHKGAPTYLSPIGVHAII